jgi:transcription-repair coupling factor (superfamily II helicase)
VSHPRLIEAMQCQPAFARMRASLPAPGRSIEIEGLAGSSPALLAAALAMAEPQRVWIVVAPSPGEAEAVEADLQALTDPGLVMLYPQREALPYEAAEPLVEVGGLRVEAVEALLTGRTRILVATVRALQERADIPAQLAELRLTVHRGDTIRPQELAERLETMGFQATPLVEGVGEYALRGGILDVFGFGAPDPSRFEFWGDDIVSIRRFDVLDQRSTGEMEAVDILPVDLHAAAAGEDDSVRRSLLDLLPRDALLLELDAADTADELRRTWDEVLHLHAAARRHGARAEPPAALFLAPDDARARLAAFGRLSIGGDAPADIRFDCRPAEAIDRDMDRLAALLRTGAARSEDTLILCDNSGQLDRLEEILGGHDGALPPRTTLAVGAVSRGFVLEGVEPPLRVLTDHEIFQRARRLRRTRRFRGAVALESLAQLKPGDYVVHLDHGIGRFRGLEHVRVADQEIEALSIEYAGEEVLRVPVYRLDLIERWVPDREGVEAPPVHRIGSKAWHRLRRRTEDAIQRMAAELLELYAARQLAERPAYSADSRWQKEMESSFLYEDTPDQRQATLDVKRDLESRRPMDRLICGDVGYGKTEVAIRAAFKIVQDGRQVAVLAPTTILVEQHLRTFRERLAPFPVRIEALSRFRSLREQREVLARLAAGEIDILIGTHRLLQGDVVFKSLGLVVVDEEQRFGVKQKERLKDLKRNVDVLAMTATPIPRTLHMSLAGLRDLSLMQTPPRDRMPVITHALPWSDEVIQDAIRRELDRGGQVFFVHNRIESIGGVTERVRELVPDVLVAIAHGRLPAAELDDVMRRFIHGAVGVLVTTAIIENGLDVPTANTLIVHRADQFGLAQLYQLRGRVGRSHHRAYCYLLIPDGVTEEAEKRLRILEHFTELGSGYAIALKDLELRGAGNLLGQEQSGFVHAVGLDTYTRLLEDAIQRLKRGHQEPGSYAAPEVSLDGAAFLPDAYIADPAQKLHLYRRLSRVEELPRLEALALEIRDRYGPPPPEVRRLLATARLRLLGARLGVEKILVRHAEARLNFRDGVVPRLAALQTAFRDRQLDVDVRRAMPLSLVLKRFGAEPVEELLAQALTLLEQQKARAA